MDEVYQKHRNLSSDFRIQGIHEFRYQYGKKKLSNLNARTQKFRPKSNLMEKERLYDENIHLKQLFNGILEENTRLRTRLQQREKDFKRTLEKPLKDHHGSSLVLTLKQKNKELKTIIEKMTEDYSALKLSLKATRVAEIQEEAKHYFNECCRLKKILEESTKSGQPKHVKSVRSEDYSNNDERFKELNNSITSLKLENSDLKSQLALNELEIERLKRDSISYPKPELTVNKPKPESSLSSNSPPSPKEEIPSKVFNRGLTNMQLLNPDRELNRELFSSENMILDSFFAKLLNQISANHLSIPDFINQIDPASKHSLPLLSLGTVLNKHGYKFSGNEVKAVYDILSKNLNSSMISTEAIINYLQTHEQDSSKSYDISSESSYREYIPDNDLAIAKILNVKLEEIIQEFQQIEVILAYNGYSKEKFTKYLEGMLTQKVDISTLAKLFLDRLVRIESGVERNKVCSFLLSGHEFVEKPEVISKLNELIFVHSFEADVKAANLSAISKKLEEHSEEFLRKCGIIDNKDRELLSWEQIESILNETLTNVDSEEMFILKVKCYGYEKSLQIVPYKSLVGI